MQKTDTHFYDGNVSTEDLRGRIDKANSIDYDIKQNSLNNLRNWAVSAFPDNGQALTALNLIIQGSGNQDNVNNLDAGSLLYLCWIISQHEKISESDFSLVFSTQLSEIMGGACPQGRTIRLLQVIKAFSQYFY
jgi:hypothetical protein